MKKIFLAVLIAFGAVSFGFGGASYEQCVNMATDQCIWSQECKTAECKANCVKWANDNCHSEDEECRNYCEKNYKADNYGTYSDCYQLRCQNYWLKTDTAPGAPW